MSAARSLLVSAPAVQQLQAGCSHLGLPSNTAVELVRFLTLKRLISLLSPSSKSLGVSPGYQLDRLWHWMLLNTQVARAVHALVGGEVEHATTDVVPLGDDTKMLRRLLALNLMVREGWAPDLTLWQEPDTIMAAIIQVPLPGDTVPLYISRATTPQQQQLLQVDLLAATQGAAGGATAQRPDHTVPAPAAAMASGAAAAAVAAPPHGRTAVATEAASCSAASRQEGPGATRGARKRPHPGAAEGAQGSNTRGLQQQQQRKQQRKQQQQQQRDVMPPDHTTQPAPLCLTLQDQQQTIVFFNVRPTVRLGKVFQRYADFKALDCISTKFMYKGMRLLPERSPADYEMEDGDTIEVVMEQMGC